MLLCAVHHNKRLDTGKGIHTVSAARETLPPSKPGAKAVELLRATACAVLPTALPNPNRSTEHKEGKFEKRLTGVDAAGTLLYSWQWTCGACTKQYESLYNMANRAKQSALAMPDPTNPKGTLYVAAKALQKRTPLCDIKTPVCKAQTQH
jgi:hypothetical protein